MPLCVLREREEVRGEEIKVNGSANRVGATGGTVCVVRCAADVRNRHRECLRHFV